jgi:DnaJ homolog subfamily C member 11
MAYRKLALIWHPDRHTDPEARAHATAKFARLTHIHDTLTNPTKRRLYNLYGEKGLSSGLEVGAHLPTAEQIRAAYAKHQRVVRQERELARLGLSGVLQTTVSLAQWPPLLRLLQPDSPDVVQFRGKGARSVGRMGPSGMQLRSSMLAERFATQLSRKDAVEVAGQMIVQGQQGGGLVSFMLKRSFSPRSGAKVRMHWGMEDSPLALSTFRALSASTVAKIHMRLSAAGSQLRCACSRQVSAAVLGKLQYIIGGTESGVKLRAHRQGERGTARAEAWIGFGAFSLSASLARRLSKRSGLSATLNLGQGGAQVEVGMRRRISARSSFAAACALSLAKGVTLKLSLGRMNQDLSVPLLLSPLVTLRSVVVGAVLPALAGALLKIVWLAPRQRRRKERRRQRLRSEHAESVARAREEARGDIELMRGAVGRKRATESARNGLVIVRAVFGRLPPRQDSDLHWPPEPNPAETGGAGDTVDVTIPLQVFPMPCHIRCRSKSVDVLRPPSFPLC